MVPGRTLSAFAGARMFSPGLEPGWDGLAFAIHLEGFGSEHGGRTICLDSVFFPARGKLALGDIAWQFLPIVGWPSLFYDF